MSDRKRQALKECGVDYDEGMEKFMGEEELYDGLLVDFLTENTFDGAALCLEKGDEEGFLKAVHAMKSVTGTLSMNRLYRLCFDTVEHLRNGEPEAAKESFISAYEEYGQIACCIRKEIGGRAEEQNVNDQRGRPVP
ncbi:histidine kinase [Ruminococcus sp.]|uniref:Hpt domain-containing protein n=1 Tax=Ruminococcus sp. TaxID=41978 RepID=UPI0025D9D418|nr:histidine kinase [Ruminococcus sp.]MBQ8965933.1 histidine kinase [Ruminococcus sp.]